MKRKKILIIVSILAIVLTLVSGAVIFPFFKAKPKQIIYEPEKVSIEFSAKSTVVSAIVDIKADGNGKIEKSWINREGKREFKYSQVDPVKIREIVDYANSVGFFKAKSPRYTPPKGIRGGSGTETLTINTGQINHSVEIWVYETSWKYFDPLASKIISLAN